MQGLGVAEVMVEAHVRPGTNNFLAQVRLPVSTRLWQTRSESRCRSQNAFIGPLNAKHSAIKQGRCDGATLPDLFSAHRGRQMHW